MLGAGRPAKRPEITAVRELTVEEVRTIPRSRTAVVLQLRDTHHMVARLFALGLRPNEVAMRTGYSLGRLSTLRNDPAMNELIANYRDSVDESWRETTDEYFESASFVRTTSLRQIRDRLEEADLTGEKIPLNQLLALHADTADRTGYPKRKEALNINLDFAGQLEKAVRRSAEVMKTIDHVPTAALQPPLSSSQGNPAAADPPASDGARSGATAQVKSLDAPAPGSSFFQERRKQNA